MNSKDKVLFLLEQNRDTYISGEKIAVEIGLSRNSVWKAVNALRSYGYMIEAVSNKGYRLAGESDLLSVQGISPFLDGRVDPSHIHVYPELESTNDTAKKLAVSGQAPDGTVIIADRQTRGRGRRERSFFSPTGGLYISFVLRPRDTFVTDRALYTVFAAVCACQAIEETTGVRPRIKWVNDITLHGRKLAGILTESGFDMESGMFSWVVIGVGINVNTRPEDFPGDLVPIAASLAEETGGRKLNRNALAAALINRIMSYPAFRNQEQRAAWGKDLIAQYKDRLGMLGKAVTVSGAELFRARALDVNDEGNLIVEKEDGSVCLLSAGEISIIPEKQAGPGQS